MDMDSSKYEQESETSTKSLQMDLKQAYSYEDVRGIQHI